VAVFLKDGLQDSDRQLIQEEIEKLPQVQSARYISKEDALLKTKEMFADRKEILEGLEDSNPLPSSFEIELKTQFLADIKEVAERLNGFDGVEDIQYAERTSELVRKVQTALIIIGSTLGLASIAIICFSIMLTSYMRREEIRIMRLVGATGPFIRLPLLLQGIIQGVLGSAIGLAILYGLLYLLPVEAVLISFLPTRQIALILWLGAFMGFVGGAVPLRRLLKI
jgi:cell division transport system permease protein